MKKRIKVTTVGPGVFSTENTVSFEADGKEYTLLVDKDFLRNDTLEVQVVAEGEKEALIDSSARHIYFRQPDPYLQR